MFKILSHLIIVICTAMSLLSCTTNVVNRNQAFEDGDYEEAQEQNIKTLGQTKAERLNQKLISAEEALASQQKISLEVDSDLLLKNVIEPLKNIVLNKDYLLDRVKFNLKNKYDQYIIPRLIVVFNEALLLIHQSDATKIKNFDILNAYKSLIFYDCNLQIESTCLLIKKYKSIDANNITKIIKLIFQQETNHKEQLKLIEAAYEIKNQTKDSEINAMLLQLLVEININAENESSYDFKKMASLFSNVLKVSITDIQNQDNHTELLKDLDAWKLLTRKEINVTTLGMSDLVRLLGKHIYKENSLVENSYTCDIPINLNNSNLSPDLQCQIEKLKYQLSNGNEQGLLFQKENLLGRWKKLKNTEMASLSPLNNFVLEKIKKYPNTILFENRSKNSPDGKSKNIADELLQKTLNTMNWDEYYYLTHMLFFGHYQKQDAKSFWEGTKKDQIKLLKTFLGFIKVQFATNIVYTNTLMNDFYIQNKNIDLIQILKKSSDEASKIKNIWAKLENDINLLEDFASSIKDTNNLEAIEMLNHLMEVIADFQKNIKFTVTYPNMFPLIQVMASGSLTAEVKGVFGTPQTISSDTVISYFFEERFNPWFNFHHNGDKLDRNEILYTFYYALVTKIFDTFSENTVVNFSTTQFFEVVLEMIISKTELELSTAYDDLTEKKRTQVSRLKLLTEVCQEEGQLQKQEEMFIKNSENEIDWVNDYENILQPRKNITNQIAFSDLGKSIYKPTHFQLNGTGLYIQDVFSENMLSVITKIRTDFEEETAYAKVLIEIYAKHNNAETDKIDALIKEQFKKFNRLKANYLSSIYETQSQLKSEQYGYCHWLIAKRHKDIKQSILFKEVKYLENLFESLYATLSDKTIEEIKNPSISLTKDLQAIKKEHFTFTQRPIFPQKEYQDKFGKTSITTQSLTTYKMDVYARLASYLENSPHLEGQYQINFPDQFTSSNNIYGDTKTKSIEFDWSEDKNIAREKFVSAGLIIFTEYLDWAKKPLDLASYESKGKVLINLFKMGEFSSHPDINCKSILLNQDVRNKHCKSFSAADVLDYYKSFIDFINLNERDEIILNLLGKSSTYNSKTYESLIKKNGVDKIYSQFDMVYLKVFSENDIDKAVKTWFKKILVSFVSSMQKKENAQFLFEPPKYIDEIFRKKYSNWIAHHFDTNRKFIKEIKKRIHLHKDSEFKFRYRLDEEIVNLSSGIGPLEPLISNLILGKFVQVSQKLNTDTSLYFSQTFIEESSDLEELFGEKIIANTEELEREDSMSKYSTEERRE